MKIFRIMTMMLAFIMFQQGLMAFNLRSLIAGTKLACLEERDEKVKDVLQKLLKEYLKELRAELDIAKEAGNDAKIKEIEGNIREVEVSLDIVTAEKSAFLENVEKIVKDNFSEELSPEDLMKPENQEKFSKVLNDLSPRNFDEYFKIDNGFTSPRDITTKDMEKIEALIRDLSSTLDENSKDIDAKKIELEELLKDKKISEISEDILVQIDDIRDKKNIEIPTDLQNRIEEMKTEYQQRYHAIVENLKSSGIKFDIKTSAELRLGDIKKEVKRAEDMHKGKK